jgi:hypothetical protein
MPNKLVCTLNPYTFSDAKLKQFALMFDELTTGKTWLESVPNKNLYNQNIHTAINYLVQQQILRDREFYKDKTEKARENLLNKHGKEFKTKIVEMKKMSSLIDEIDFEKAIFAMSEREEKVAFTKGCGDLVTIFNSKQTDFLSSDPNITFAPMLTGQCFNPLYKEAIKNAVSKETFDSSPFFAKEKSDITRIVLSKLPVPAEDTPWEDVIGFKQDGKTQDQIHRIRRWMQTANENRFDEKRVSDEIDELLYEYEIHMNHYLKKFNHAVQEAAFVTPLEILEDIIKFKWGNIPKKAFALRNQKVDLNFAERSFPGQEVAYIHSARKTFGTE